MTKILHQQRLLLELLKMSGDIGAPDKDDGTILYQTLIESRNKGWITLTPFGAGVDKAAITDSGRAAIKESRKVQVENPGGERRRPPRS